MANFVASVSPSAPIIAIYIHEIVRMLALPHGAAATAPIDEVRGVKCEVSGETTECPGKKGTRCSATPIGPTPGPPPPCGMQNVLCRFKCETSPPNCPGFARPTSALRFAPSMYT